MDVYSLDGHLKDAAAQLPVPGTYKTWRQIDPPAWASPEKLRPLDDPELDQAWSQLDKKRHKGDAQRSAGDSQPPADRTFPYRRKD